MRAPHLTCLFLLILPSFPADISSCACDVSKPETMQARECGLCKEAENASAEIFFLKDINPRKPNRWLALPKEHGRGGHSLDDMPPKLRAALWAGAIEKARQLFGDEWGLAYNGDKVRTQCHAHIHLGKLLKGIETERFITVKGPDQIPLTRGEGLWVHPAEGGLHIHLGEQITETVLLR